MTLRSVVLLLALVSQYVTAESQGSTISFVGPMRVGSEVTVKGNVGDSVKILSAAAGAAFDCSQRFASLTTMVLDDGSAPGAASTKLTTSPQTIKLKNPLTLGINLCLRSDHADPQQVVTSVYSVQSTAVLAALVGVDFASPPLSRATSISVAVAALPADVFVYRLPADYLMPAEADGDCTFGNLQTSLQIGPTDATSQVISAPGAQSILLSKPLVPGDQLCLVSVSGGVRTFSALVHVQASQTGLIRILSELVAGTNIFSFRSDASGTVNVYSFGAGYNSGDGRLTCNESDLQFGSPLSLTSTGSGGSGSSTTTAISVTADSLTTAALSTPLDPNTQLCLVEMPTAGGAYVAFSPFKAVNPFGPGGDYGRFAMGFTGGVIISNEQKSSGSSTASQYLDVNFTYTLIRGLSGDKYSLLTERSHPGLISFLNVRSAAVPVSTTNTSSQTATTTSGTTTTLTQSLNALSSQQSARILGGIYAPFRLTRWYRRTNWITLAPLAVGGFDTLLNPTAPSSAPSSENTLNSTTANFSSVYEYKAGGGELGWIVDSASSDQAPRTMAWFSATLGNYSNLPSYICTASSASDISGAKSFMDTVNPVTSCYVASVTSTGGQTSYQVYASRKLVPRLDVAGELNLPSLPVVLGLDANLGQYWIQGKNVDIMNKPGNDVRIFFGLRFDLLKALSKLGVPSQ